MKPHTLGIIYGIIAYLVWGMLPLFWQHFEGVNPDIVSAHRLIWSTVILLIVLAVSGRIKKLTEKLKEPKTLAFSFLSGVLLYSNWVIYIWAIHNGRVISVSLGYFLLPLVFIIIGYFMLKESMSKLQLVAVGIATLGVCMQGLGIGSIPWAALLVALTFAIYGVSKKKMQVDGLSVLTLEVGLLSPFAIAYLYNQHSIGNEIWMDGSITSFILIALTGLVTITPLLLFTASAKRIPLNLIGMLQFIAPTGQFLLGLLYYNEVIKTEQVIAFSLIWIAIIIYSISKTKLLKSSS